jgi:PHD/YefM family antitoxin component YafN of YafNO toxin-antitoxin module
MREFSTVELLRDLTGVIHAAARAAVAITQHRKPRFVLMALDDYQRLAAAHTDPRRAYRAYETPPEPAAILRTGLNELIGEEEGGPGAA